MPPRCIQIEKFKLHSLGRRHSNVCMIFILLREKGFFGAKLEDDYNKRHFLKGKQLYPQTGLDPLL